MATSPALNMKNAPASITSASNLCWTLMVMSGAAALSYEICWIRMFALGLGHEMPATVAVLAAFFVGLAGGAWILDARIRRSPNAVRWYVMLELVIGGWAVVTIATIPWINSRIGDITGPAPSVSVHWLVAFAVPLFFLAPATLAMGATMPAMDQIMQAMRGHGRWVGAIYAANTLGAVLGTLATTFMLLPRLGFTRTLLFACLLNLLAALVAWARLSHLRVSPEPIVQGSSNRISLLPLLLFTTGVLGIGFEILGTRVMAQVQENTVYSFASVLSVYLFGTTLGAAAYQRWLTQRDQTQLLKFSLGLLSISTLVGILVLSRSPDIHLATLLSLGPGLARAVATEITLAILVFGAPTVLMGLTFSVLAQMWRDGRGSVGGALGWNTLGAALATGVFAPLLLPAIGAKWALVSVSAGYVLLWMLVWMLTPRPSKRVASSQTVSRRRRSSQSKPVITRAAPSWYLLAPTVALAAFAMFAELKFVSPLEGGKVLAYRDGVMASVAVVTDKHDNRFLKVNDRFRMGGTDSPSHERRLGHVPLLLHPHPKSVLFLGLGTGNTLAAAADHPDLHATAVELVPEVVLLQPYFEESTGKLSEQDSLRIHTGDARRFVRATDQRYDVIVADLFHPARDGSGALYTREHFQAVRRRLRTNGLFCQWLPLYQMDTACLKIIVRTYMEVFPDAVAFLSNLDVRRPVLGLIASTAEQEYDAAWFTRRLEDAELRGSVVKSGIVDPLSFFGLAVAGADHLRSFSQDANINTDDHTWVTFASPEFIYGAQSPGYVPLFALLQGRAVDRATLRFEDQQFDKRVAAFESARDAFLHAEVLRTTGKLEAAGKAYVQSAAASGDFVLAPTMAVILAKRLNNGGQSRQALDLLRHLNAVRPHPETQVLLQRWESTTRQHP